MSTATPTTAEAEEMQAAEEFLKIDGLPVVVRYFDNGYRYGILFKRGRDFLHMITTDGMAGQVVHIRKWLRMREKDWKVHQRAGLAYDPARAAQHFLKSGDLLGMTGSAKIVLIEIVDGKPAAAEEQVQLTGEHDMTAKAEQVVIEPNLKDYKKTKAASGRKSLDIGDDIAKMLREKTLDEVYEIAAKKLDVSARSLKDKYGKLNAGMQRMNLGNRLRGLVAAKAKKATEKK